MIVDYDSNPDKYYWRYVIKELAGKEETNAMRFGTTVDEYLSDGTLPGTHLPKDVIVIPEEVLTSNGQRRGKKWEAWKAEHDDGSHELWSPKEYKDWKQECHNVLQVARQIESHAEAKALLAHKKRLLQPTILFDEPGTGLACKSRPDFVIPSQVHVDLKTSNSIKMRSITKSILDYGYHIQAYMAQLGWQIERDETLPFTLVVMLNKPPFSVEVVNLDQRWLDIGAEQFHYAMDCIAAKNYRREGYGKPLLSVPPNWLLRQYQLEEE